MFIKIFNCGYKYYFKDYLYMFKHNSYGSATFSMLYKIYSKDNKLHNQYGPAVKNRRTSYKLYYLNGKKYSHSEWLKQLNKKE